MSDTLSPSFRAALTSGRGLYSLVLGTALGSTVWHSVVGGPVAFASLPRASFGHLQSRLFPHFFRLQTGSALALLTFYYRAGVKLAEKATWRGDRNLWLVATMLASAAFNEFVVGPWTTKVMQRRHRKEKIEGKDYSDASASSEMKALNKTFGKLHGASSLLNLTYLVAIAVHAAHVGAFGAPWTSALRQ
ncbi:hypothetical protein JCM8547_002279 [Rhodosporidiobolus lusitaniae]